MWVVIALLLPFLVTVMSDQDSTSGSCVANGDRFECIGDIPQAVPDNITDIYVNYDSGPIDKGTFLDKSWANVKTFHVHVDKEIGLNVIEDFTFSSLSGLTSLKINAADLKSVGEQAFVGLSKLEILDLSGCKSLEIGSLVSALENRNVSSVLDSLSLNDVGSAYSRILHLKRDFFDMVKVKNISKVSLANTNLYVEEESLTPDDISPMVELNISYSNPYTKHRSTALLMSILRNLRVFDMSGYERRRRFHRELKEEGCAPNKFRLPFYTRMERIYANNCKTSERYFENYIINAMNCRDINLKTLHLRGSMIERFNWTFFWPMHAPKIDLDLSYNGMTYFYIKGHVPCSILNLSHNRLTQMETNSSFVDAFLALPFLEKLVISNNGLQNLPRDIFRHNTRLHTLELQDNRLTTLSFRIEHLENLQLLDLRKNHIKYIGTRDLSVIDSLQARQLELNITPVIEVDFRYNQIECSCKNYQFIKWIWSKRNHTTAGLYTLSCSVDGQQSIEIDDTVLGQVDFLCKRTLIVAASSLGVVLIFSASLGCACLWKTVIRKRERRRFIDLFIQRQTRERFLALISHSNADGNIVNTVIRQRLEVAIRKEIPAEFDLLCLGDFHFQPGVSLIDEIHRCVMESCVAIFAISQAFCESGYCRREMKEAYEQSKPIILIFLEEVDEQAMTPLMNSIFRKYERLKVIQEDDNVIITPSWDNLANSIITEAVNERIQNTTFQNCCGTNIQHDLELVQQE